MMKKRVIISFIMLVLIMALGGCASSAKQEQSTKPEAKTKAEAVKVDVGILRGPSAISLIKMVDEKPSLGEGVTVNYTVEQSPDVLSSKILSGEMELATIPTNMAAILYNKGVPYQMLASNNWGVMYVVSNGVPVSKWSDLKGQTVGAVSKGAASDVVFKYLLSKNGVSPDKDVTITYSPSPVELAQMVMAGKIKLAALPEPWVSVVNSKNPQIKVIFDLQKEWKNIQGADTPFAQTCLVVNKNFAAQHPDIVKSFLTNYANSLAWVNKNPKAAAELIKKNDIGIPAEVAEAAIPRCNLGYMNASEARPAVEKFLKVLMDFSPESVGGKIPDDKFYYQK